MKMFQQVPENLLESQDFLIGFEVEMLFNSKEINHFTFSEMVQKLHPKIIVGSDGSVSGDGRSGYSTYEYPFEIKTPPLPPSQSLEVLQKVFELVNKYGYTNSSCGFHLNFSPVPDNLYSAIDPFEFVQNNLWERIKKDFNRLNNKWCRRVLSDEQFAKLKNKLLFFDALQQGSFRPIGGKAADVNFIHYFREKQTRRIEVRAFGGEAYHTKFELIKNYTNEILKTFLSCCEA